MKVIFFINRISDVGGSERVATVVANKLASLGHEVVFVSWMGPAKSFFPLHESINVHLLSETKINIYKGYLTSLFKYRKLIKEIKPDYVVDVCTAMSLLSIPATALGKAKVISWEHFNTTVNWNPFTSRISRWMAAKFAKSIVVLTETDRKNYLENFGANFVERIPNPVTVKINASADLEQKNVLAIGRFTNQKGFDMLLLAWQMVINAFPEWKLRIVGDGELKGELLESIKELKLENSVKLIDPTLDIEDYYKTSSIFVLSSRFEGLPLVLIEAKAYGLPIVAFDCETGPRDVVRDNIDGFLVPSGNIEQFAGALKTLMESESKRNLFGSNGIKDLDRFNLDKIIIQWLALFEK